MQILVLDRYKIQGSYILNTQVIEYFNPSFKISVQFDSKTTNIKIMIDIQIKEIWSLGLVLKMLNINNSKYFEDKIKRIVEDKTLKNLI